MIPKVIPPLTDLTVLVTRPAPQCAGLCEQIRRHGGSAIAFPAIEIEPLPAAPAQDCDLIVFLSVHAVAHGAHLIARTPGEKPAARIAAIGKGTAAALAAIQMPADIVPESGFTSEDLLAHPSLALTPGTRVLVVHGTGGRGLLQETFIAHGMVVESLEVYRRVQPVPAHAERMRIEACWADEGIDVVTLTSVETLQNLLTMLTQSGRELLARTALLVVSQRIADAAVSAGLRGCILHAASADDNAMIGALAQWRTRARMA